MLDNQSTETAEEIKNNKLFHNYDRFLDVFYECFRDKELSDPWCQKNIKKRDINDCCANLFHFAKRIDWFYDKETRVYDINYLVKIFNQHDYYRFLDDIWNFALDYFIPKYIEAGIIDDKLKNIIETTNNSWEKLKVLYYYNKKILESNNIRKELDNVQSEEVKIKVLQTLEVASEKENPKISLILMAEIYRVIRHIKRILDISKESNHWFKIDLSKIDFSITDGWEEQDIN